MRVVTRIATSVADRLLELVAPHTAARATDCDFFCCGTNRWQYCCFYPDGHYNCQSCFQSSSSVIYC